MTPCRIKSFKQEPAAVLPKERGVTQPRSRHCLDNVTRRSRIATSVRRAISFWERGAGLLALPPLQPGEALWLEPCGSIHTWGMRYAIDVVFLNKDLRVLAVWRNVRPWKIAWAPRGTHVAVELLGGEAEDVSRGDTLRCWNG